MAKGFFLLLLFAASHSHSATSESVISVNDGDTSIEALIREKIPGWINGQQTMKKRISKENHKIPSLSQIMRAAMKEAEDDKGTFRVNINCREDDDKIKTTTRMKRFLDVEKPDQISTLLGHFEFFGHVSQRNFFFGSRCLINTEFGDKNSSDKKKKSGGEKAAKLRRKKIRKPFGLEPLDATYRKYGIAEIRGSFGSQGRLEGPVWIRMGDHSLIQAEFCQGAISGPLTFYALNKFQEDEEYFVRLLAAFENGIPVPPFWYFTDGSMQLAQYFDDAELTTGASIYPDFETVLIGHFWKFRLVSGRQSRITSSRLSKKNGHQGRGGVPELRFEEPGASSAAVFAFDPPSHYRFGDDPTIPDPYESKNVQVGTWTEAKDDNNQEEEALYAKRKIAKGKIAAFYSGLRVPCDLDFKPKKATGISNFNVEEEEHRRTEYLLSLVRDKIGTNTPGDECIDIPPEFGRNMTLFRATLGHKANHRFQPNTKFSEVFHHPRYGFIMSLVAIKDILPGEEITVNYNYELDTSPNWYRRAHKVWRSRGEKFSDGDDEDVVEDEDDGADDPRVAKVDRDEL